jgi:hypothetical protein
MPTLLFVGALVVPAPDLLLLPQAASLRVSFLGASLEVATPRRATRRCLG